MRYKNSNQMTATTYWISNLFIHYWQRPESFWIQSRNHLVFKDIMCINEIFWWLAIFSHFMIFHHVKLVWKSILKRNRTPYNRANIMPYESALVQLTGFVYTCTVTVCTHFAHSSYSLTLVMFYPCTFLNVLSMYIPFIINQ